MQQRAPSADPQAGRLTASPVQHQQDHHRCTLQEGNDAGIGTAGSGQATVGASLCMAETAGCWLFDRSTRAEGHNRLLLAGVCMLRAEHLRLLMLLTKQLRQQLLMVSVLVMPTCREANRYAQVKGGKPARLGHTRRIVICRAQCTHHWSVNWASGCCWNMQGAKQPQQQCMCPADTTCARAFVIPQCRLRGPWPPAACYTALLCPMQPALWLNFRVLLACRCLRHPNHPPMNGAAKATNDASPTPTNMRQAISTQ